ncbi:hypothetical protein [Enterobacter sp. 22466]|uniref:hypothetical protein n=1 Tax=Enterobacter sp. 22466 TaxID=3453924 RepID=UPI003F82DD1C
MTTPLWLSHLVVMYHPVVWCHHSHIPESWQRWVDKPAAHPLLNHWLARQYQLLERDLSISKREDHLLQSAIQHWHRLPDAAMLIGSLLLRDDLLAQGRHLFCSSAVQTFIALPLPEVQYRSADMVMPPPLSAAGQPLQTGASFLFALFSQFSPALHKRARLLFPLTLGIPKGEAPLTPANINLLIMALNHAYHFS